MLPPTHTGDSSFFTCARSARFHHIRVKATSTCEFFTILALCRCRRDVLVDTTMYARGNFNLRVHARVVLDSPVLFFNGHRSWRHGCLFVLYLVIVVVKNKKKYISLKLYYHCFVPQVALLEWWLGWRERDSCRLTFSWFGQNRCIKLLTFKCYINRADGSVAVCAVVRTRLIHLGR